MSVILRRLNTRENLLLGFLILFSLFVGAVCAQLPVWTELGLHPRCSGARRHHRPGRDTRHH